MTDKTIFVAVHDKRVRKGVIRCLESLEVTFSEVSGTIRITDTHPVDEIEDSTGRTLLVTDGAAGFSRNSILLPMRFSTMRNLLQKFLTDNSI